MINIPIYESKEIYKECFFNIDEDFDESNSPLFKAILTFNRTKASNKDEIIRFCLITKDFLKYKKENNLNDITPALQTYMKQMTDDKAKYLWLTTSYHKGEQLLLYPFLIINDKMPSKTFLHLNKESIEEFTNIISSSLNLNKDEIYVPGYIASFNTILEKKDMLEGLGLSYIYDKKQIKFSIMEEQENNVESNIFPFTIPFFVKKELNYKLKLEDLENYYENTFLKKDNAKEISKKIKELLILDDSFQIFAIIDDFIITEEIFDIYKEIEELINSISKKKTIFNIFNKKK